LRTLEVPKPPIELQNQFAIIVEKIEGIKTVTSKASPNSKPLWRVEPAGVQRRTGFIAHTINSPHHMVTTHEIIDHRRIRRGE